MKVPKLETIQQWRASGKMRKTDEVFWEGDRKVYDSWLYMVEKRVERWQENKK